MSVPHEPGLSLSMSAERFEALVREEIRALLPIEEARRIRRELLLMLATISSDEGGVVLGISARHFRGLCEREKVPVENLGHKTPRYRVTSVSAALDRLAVGAGKDLDDARAQMLQQIARIMRELDELQLRSPDEEREDLLPQLKVA